VSAEPDPPAGDAVAVDDDDGTLSLPDVARGDPMAVRRCIDRYGGLVWALARRHCQNPADAEDAVQEIFVDLWKSAHRFDPAVAGEATFVATIARRRLIDRYRRRARAAVPEPLDDGPGHQPTASAPDPDTTLDAQRAAALLGHLSADQQRVVLLSTQGLSHAEIAESTRMPLGTVKSHVRRGLLQLRSALRREATQPELPAPSGGVTS